MTGGGSTTEGMGGNVLIVNPDAPGTLSGRSADAQLLCG